MDTTWENVPDAIASLKDAGYTITHPDGTNTLTGKPCLLSMSLVTHPQPW